MPSLGRMRSLVQGQGGSTLIELLVAMPIGVLLLLVSMAAFENAGRSQRDVEQRSHAVMEATQAMERMTRELRQASWVFFRSSQILEADTVVRVNGTAVRRYVRYECTGRGRDRLGHDIGGTCERFQGDPVAYPPPVGAPATSTGILIQGFEGLDVFHPQSVDASTGKTYADFSDPALVTIRLRMRGGVGAERRVVEIRDGVALRNGSGARG
jgi:hypothetical protein